MASVEHKRCYGKLFPSVLGLEVDRTVSGKAFEYRIERAGGTFVSRRGIAVQMDQWDDCLECPEFDSCYKLSMAKLTLETAVAGS